MLNLTIDLIAKIRAMTFFHIIIMTVFCLPTQSKLLATKFFTAFKTLVIWSDALVLQRYQSSWHTTRL